MHEMHAAGRERALQEVLFLHVDLATRRPVDLDADAAARVAGLSRQRRRWPAWLGRHVGQAR